MELIASEIKVIPVLESQKGKGFIPLSVAYRQEVDPFPYVGEIVTCAALRAIQTYRRYQLMLSKHRDWYGIQSQKLTVTKHHS